tara:strand:- start:1570 stop:1806 length:237 start_codon:yes stop_codon:yes gene_type:complete
MIELTVTNLTLGVLVGEFVIILVLFWHIGRESMGHSMKAKADEREAIVRLIQSTRRGLKSADSNELRDALIEKVRARN